MGNDIIPFSCKALKALYHIRNYRASGFVLEIIREMAKKNEWSV